MDAALGREADCAQCTRGCASPLLHCNRIPRRDLFHLDGMQAAIRGYVKNHRLATPGIRSSTPSGASVASGANDAKVVIYDDIVFAGQRLEWSALQLAT
jgi:hypothetical protein